MWQRARRRQVIAGRNVLLVEDDPALRRTIAAILKAEGFEVAVAQDGLEALAQLDHFAADVVVLDLMLPRMDGVTFAEELQRRGRRHGLSLIVLSADLRARQKARQVGAEALIEKPFTIEALLTALQTYPT
ncbi:MAG: response regulator [Chloroflexi bacterium]|nr:response regulator [Chloroflexota bacterium]